MLLFEESTDFFGEVWEGIKGFFVGDGWQKIVIALAMAVLGGFVISFLCWLLRKILYRTAVDNAAVTFFSALLAVVLWIVMIFAIANILSISTESLLVAFSSIALAVGLALKDSLANLANGILIIANKPFKRGDHIEINGIDGIVQNIKLMTVEFITFDNKLLVLPNSAITTNNVINFSALPTRRVDRTFSVAYGTDMDLVEKVLRQTIEDDREIIDTPTPAVYMSNHGSDGIEFTVKVWTETQNYWSVYNRLPSAVYQAFCKNNINIPFPQVDVHFDEPNAKKAAKKSEAVAKTTIDSSAKKMTEVTPKKQAEIGIKKAAEAVRSNPKDDRLKNAEPSAKKSEAVAKTTSDSSAKKTTEVTPKKQAESVRSKPKDDKLKNAEPSSKKVSGTVAKTPTNSSAKKMTEVTPKKQSETVHKKSGGGKNEK